MFSSRLRRHKNRYDGLSPYSLWILVGIILFGLKVDQHYKKKRIYVLKTQDGSFINRALHPSAVNLLVDRELLVFTKDRLGFSLTDKGLILAYRRMQEAGINLTASEIAKNLRLGKISYVILNKIEQTNQISDEASVFESSVFVG